MRRRTAVCQHTLDAALVMAADTVSGYIQALLDGAELSHTHHALDRRSRKAALARFLTSAGEAEKAGMSIAA